MRAPRNLWVVPALSLLTTGAVGACVPSLPGGSLPDGAPAGP
jgi:hypothetical protein